MGTARARLVVAGGLGFIAPLVAYVLGFPTTGLWIAPLWLAGAAIGITVEGGLGWLAGVSGILATVMCGSIIAAFTADIGPPTIAGLMFTVMLFLAPPYIHGWVAGWLARRVRRLGLRALGPLTLGVSLVEIAAAAYAVWLADELARHPL